MFDFINSFNFLFLFLFLFTLINFILICFLFFKMSVLKKQNAENNMEIHEINKDWLRLYGEIRKIKDYISITKKEDKKIRKNGNA